MCIRDRNRYFNHTLDDLSNDMIYGVEAGLVEGPGAALVELRGAEAGSQRQHVVTQMCIRDRLEADAYNPDKAVELLKADGWVYNADGSDYVDGSGEIRYKKVPEAEAQKGSSLMPGVVEMNGEFYMPLVLESVSYTHLDVYKRQA